jgi:hypothetical protein
MCAFTFADNRRCRMPRSSAHPELCTYHARKDEQSRAVQKFGRDIAGDLAGKYTSACDLTSALGHLFSAVAQGHIKPRTANTLGYIAQTMVQSIELAQHEFITTFGKRAWAETIADNLYPDRKTPSSAPAVDPEAEPNSATRCD